MDSNILFLTTSNTKNRMNKSHMHRMDALAKHSCIKIEDINMLTELEDNVSNYSTIILDQFCYCRSYYKPNISLTEIERILIKYKSLNDNNKVIMLFEDLHPITFLGGNKLIFESINKANPDIMVTHYECSEWDFIKNHITNKQTQTVTIPHHINTEIYKDYNTEKKYDIFFYGCLDPIFYDFRLRLDKLFRRQKRGLNIRFFAHPGHQRYDPQKCDTNLAKMINSAWISIATISKFSYLVGKYFEISACKTVIAGNINEQGRQIWSKDDMIEINNDMTDDEILDILVEALSDKNRLKNMSERMYNKIRDNFNCDQYADKIVKLCN
ncbi:MAG: hypothetical protein KC414_14065 [Romboutsia sp.]|nr:hypothetical protein [Romboutsia sp.]